MAQHGTPFDSIGLYLRRLDLSIAQVAQVRQDVQAMRNGLVQLGAWAAATGAAVLLSWLGVHAVLADASFEQPQTLRLPVPMPSASTSPPAVHVEQTTPAPSAGTASPTRAASRKPAAATTSPAGTVRSYLVPGGRVALDMRPDQAELVSATPDADWQMQFWQGDQWMRFDFSRGDSTNSVFVTWNGHPPEVQTVVR
ncbi:hypothetical protein [Kitasatospora sp. MAP5-34]|uniref:hypothetical protein n=1 Tax=Kitasatospora sp. MAP5-34 TaxID=3035102 RepID=UPI0024770005|nr:hypothetical protein [Kitasatospora sp. MAP5-34]MDH6577152.1 hypothetical protein [Kitasatospora sp. MAP5-34]